MHFDKFDHIKLHTVVLARSYGSRQGASGWKKLIDAHLVRQCIVVCYLHTFTCVPSLFCHFEIRTHTHTSTHRAQPAVVNAMKKHIEVVAHTFSSIRAIQHARFFLLRHGRLLFSVWTLWASNQFKFTCSLLQLTFPYTDNGTFYTQKSSPLESTFCQTSRERTRMSCLTSCHMSLLHFSSEGRANRRKRTNKMKKKTGENIWNSSFVYVDLLEGNEEQRHWLRQT